jgi:hypothetical protein
MTSNAKKTVITTLREDELAELDRVRSRQNLSRAEALREAIRWYIGAVGRLRPAEDPTQDEIEAIRLGEEEFARGECRRLEDVQRELGLPTK